MQTVYALNPPSVPKLLRQGLEGHIGTIRRALALNKEEVLPPYATRMICEPHIRFAYAYIEAIEPVADSIPAFYSSVKEARAKAAKGAVETVSGKGKDAPRLRSKALSGREWLEDQKRTLKRSLKIMDKGLTEYNPENEPGDLPSEHGSATMAAAFERAKAKANGHLMNLSETEHKKYERFLAR